MATLHPNTFLTVGSPDNAAVQLIYKLTGTYRLVRRTHHSHVVQGTALAYRDLVSPSDGTSEITLQGTTTDRPDEVELMQTTVVNLRTRDGQTATRVEKRAFRVRNARWSVWAVRTDEERLVDVAVGKLADLTLSEIDGPKRARPTDVDEGQEVALRGGSWRDGNGVNALAMRVFVGRKTGWQLTHRIDRQGSGASESCIDEFWPAEDGGGRA